MNSDKIDKHRALKVRRRNYSTSVLSNHLRARHERVFCLCLSRQSEKAEKEFS